MASGGLLESAVLGTIVQSRIALELLDSLKTASGDRVCADSSFVELRNHVSFVANLPKVEDGYWDQDAVLNEADTVLKRIKTEHRTASKAWKASVGEFGTPEFEEGPMQRLSNVLERLVVDGATVIDKDVVLGAWADVSAELDVEPETVEFDEWRRLAAVKLALLNVQTVGKIAEELVQNYFRLEKREEILTWSIPILSAALAESRRHLFRSLFHVDVVSREKVPENPAEDEDEEDDDDEEDEEDEEVDYRYEDRARLEIKRESESDFELVPGRSSRLVSIFEGAGAVHRLGRIAEKGLDFKPLARMLIFGDSNARRFTLQFLFETCSSIAHNARLLAYNKLVFVRDGVVAALVMLLRKFERGELKDGEDGSRLLMVIGSVQFLSEHCLPWQTAMKQEGMFGPLGHFLQHTNPLIAREALRAVSAIVINYRNGQIAARKAGILHKVMAMVREGARGNPELLLSAVDTIRTVSWMNLTNQRIVLKDEVTWELIRLISEGGDWLVQRMACETVCTLAKNNEEAWEEIDNLGLIPHVVSALRNNPEPDSGLAYIKALYFMARHKRYWGDIPQMYVGDADIFLTLGPYLDTKNEEVVDLAVTAVANILKDTELSERAVRAGVVEKVYPHLFGRRGTEGAASLAMADIATFALMVSSLFILKFQRLFIPYEPTPSYVIITQRTVHLLVEDSWKSAVAAPILLALLLNNNDNKLAFRKAIKSTPLAREVLETIPPSNHIDPSILCLLLF